MSIVSAKLGIVSVCKGKHGPPNAIQWGYDEVPDSAPEPQKPTVNQFRKIRVPSSNPEAPPRKTKVPLYSLQDGTQKIKPMMDMPETEVLKPLTPKLSNYSFANLLTAQMATETVPFDYNSGIKPSPRKIQFDEIALSAGATFRV